MPRAAARVWLGIAFAAAFLGAVALAQPAERGSGFAIEVKISPVAGAAGQFLCEATATELATGAVVFAPRLQVLAGKSNVASSGGERGKRDYLLSVSIEGEAKEARYTLEIRDGETLIASQKAAVKLR
jgi:hypothetical protein